MRTQAASAVLLMAMLAIECSPSLRLDRSARRTVTADERTALIRRAHVWTPTRVADVNIRSGPRGDEAFEPGEEVACDFVNVTFSGRTPKFGCALNAEDRLKVRYGRNNGEVYAGVAATRLLWALGYGADALYPVHVLCRGCPDALRAEGEARRDAIAFDVAAVERKFHGADIEAPSVGPGWSWPELDLVDQAAGGATTAQRDALKLLAVLIQHSDNKGEQQRLVCRSGDGKDVPLAACSDPFMMIHDVGLTFGRANLLNRDVVGSVNLAEWSRTPVWKDAARCVGNLAPSQTGTLANPVISEAGRQFLAGLLAQLTDRQLQDLFSVAQFDEKPTGGGPIDEWVSAFKHKRDEIASAACP